MLTVLFLALSLSARAEDRLKSNLATNEISGNAQLVTHYIERGISLSDNNPALNASFLYNLGSQVRMGFWGSNISNLSAADDNFWFKILAEFNVQFANSLIAEIYISDNHYYKSNQNNGQRIGANFNYYSYTFGFEWMSNLAGTKTNGEYIQFGKYFNYGNKIRYGGNIGYTMSHSSTLSGFFDAKAYSQYLLNTSTTFEAAITINLNNSYFGHRGDPAIYGGVKLTY